MPQVAQGGTYRWTGIVKDGLGGLADPTALVLTVSAPGGGIVSPFPVDLVDIVRDSLGVYHYDWVVAVDAPLGTYEADWAAEVDGSAAVGEDTVVVIPVGAVVTPDASPSGPYQTYNRFIASSAGSVYASSPVYEIVEALEDATALVNSYCNVPLTPMPHSFLGGHAVSEPHKWRYPDSLFDHTPSRRVYPYHKPIIEVESLDLVVSAGIAASLPVSQLVVNNSEGWVEVTSVLLNSQSLIFPLYPMPLAGLMQVLALITYSYGWSLQEVDDRLYPIDEGSTIFQSSYPYWIDEGEITEDGVTIGSGFSVDTTDGRVIFDSAPTGTIRASYSHRLPREITRATGMLAAQLLGMSNISRRGLIGLERLTVGEITMVAAKTSTVAGNQYIRTTGVPAADILLDGFRYMRVA